MPPRDDGDARPAETERPITVVIATIGRPTLRRAVDTALQCLPGARIIIAPAVGLSSALRATMPTHEMISETSSLYEAWNTAIENIATGHIIFVNDDDYLVGPPLPMHEFRSDSIVNLRFRLADRPPRVSLSRILPGRASRTFDLLHSNRRGNINSYLWPRAVFSDVGPFDTSFLVAADLEWMLRCMAHHPRIHSVRGPVYVQTRGPDRLSSMHRNRAAILLEARRLVRNSSQGHAWRTRGILLRLWLANMDRARSRFEEEQ